jgi:PAS domain S-box-containing protein
MDIAHAESHFYAVLDLLPDSIILADCDGVITHVNERVMQLTGYRREELVGSSLLRLVHHVDKQELEGMLGSLRERGDLSTGFRLRRKERGSVDVTCTAGVVDEHCHFILREVTDKMKRERELQRRNREIFALYQIGKEITSTFDIDHALSRVVSNTIWVLECHIAGVALLDPVKSSISWKTVLGNKTPAFTSAPVKIGHGFVGRTMSAKTRLIVDEIPGDPTLDRTDAELFATEGLRVVLGVPVMYKEKVFGVLMIGYRTEHSFSENEIRLSMNLAAQTALALDNAHLYQSTLDHARNLEALSSRLAHVQEEERMRISRELHEGLGQVLSGIRLHLETLKSDGLLTPDAGRKRVDAITTMIDETLDEIREMAFTIRPRVLDDLGLVSALRVLLKRFVDRTHIDVEFVSPDTIGRSGQNVEGTLYRVVEEALSNVERHSGATRVQLTIAVDQRTIRIDISDNGSGFDVGTLGAETRARQGMGVFSMSERIHELNGTFELRSTIGQGTDIHIAMVLP